MKCLSLTVSALACGIGYIVKDVYDSLGFSKEITFDDGSCMKLEVPTPVEDLAAWGDGHCAFGGGGDLLNTFNHGSAGAKPGGFWFINVTAGTLTQLRVTGKTMPKLIPHGIFFSKPSQRLYAVNHDEEHGESVEVFQAKYHPKDSADSNEFLKLVHVASVRSPLFNNMALNDVVEGESENEFYVTEWLPFGIPLGGKKSPKNPLTFQGRVQALLMLPINLLKIPTTRIFRCQLLSENKHECVVASTQRFVMANGVAISNDRKSVFVNDPTGKSITVLERLENGALATVSKFVPKHMLDNIEMSSDGELHGGSIPLGFATATACDEGVGGSRVVDGRTVGCTSSPGGLTRISLLGTGGKSFVEGTQRDYAMHDGSKLDGISSALKLGDRVIMGSPGSPGILLCELQ